jgi:hypothetical protein
MGAEKLIEGKSAATLSTRVDGSARSEHLNGRRPIGHGFVDRSNGRVDLGVLNHTASATATLSQDTPLPEIITTLNRLAEQAGIARLVSTGIRLKTQSDPEAAYEQWRDAVRIYGKYNIVPVILGEDEMRPVGAGANTEDPRIAACRLVEAKFTDHGSAKVTVDERTGRVYPSEITTLEDWREDYPKDYWEKSMDSISEGAKDLDNTIVIAINTTPQAGGVAGMNHPLLRFVDAYNAIENTKQLQGQEAHPLDVRWYITNAFIDPEIAAKHGIDLQDPELLQKFSDSTDPNKIDIFKLTKMRHNLIQGVAKPEHHYTEKDDRLYEAWNETQWKTRLGEIRDLVQQLGKDPNAKKIVLKVEDQQLAAMVKYALADCADPNLLSIIFRSHIEFTTHEKAQPVINSIMDDLTGYDQATGLQSTVDAFWSHRAADDRIAAFLPTGSDGQIDSRIADIAMFKVATADSQHGLGTKLSSRLALAAALDGNPDKKDLKLRHTLAYLNELNLYLVETGQKPFTSKDIEIGFVGQSARMDPAKNHEGAVEAAVLRIDAMVKAGVPFEEIPGQIIAGFGAHDDPDGLWIESKVRKLVDEKCEQFKDTIPNLKDKFKIFRLDYSKFQDEHMNLLRRFWILGQQLSLAEGCEEFITGTLREEIPMQVADVGGMTPQIRNGQNGILVRDPRDYQEIAAVQTRLLLEQYRKRKEPQAYPGQTELERLTANARPMADLEYTTLANVRDIVSFAAVLSRDKQAVPQMVREHVRVSGQQPFVRDLAAAAYKQGMRELSFSGGAGAPESPRLNYVNPIQVFPTVA